MTEDQRGLFRRRQGEGSPRALLNCRQARCNRQLSQDTTQHHLPTTATDPAPTHELYNGLEELNIPGLARIDHLALPQQLAQ